MLQSDKDSLHYEVIANHAHKIEKVSRELSQLYKASRLNNDKINVWEKKLNKLVSELTNSLLV